MAGPAPATLWNTRTAMPGRSIPAAGYSRRRAAKFLFKLTKRFPQIFDCRFSVSPAGHRTWQPTEPMFVRPDASDTAAPFFGQSDRRRQQLAPQRVDRDTYLRQRGKHECEV